MSEGPHPDSGRRSRLRRLAEARHAVVVPPILFPAELPVSARRADIAAAIRGSQVVIVSGETGSGKTTQIPKILLELGRGRDGQIGHTQPRRIAARTVAERISEELGGTLGSIVGYQVRFTDQSSQGTLVRVMTDGILLAQIQRDPKLLAYDTLIIDEAHERSLNIDFILGYLTRLLPQRPDLKVIITSATIDSERFARHFGGVTDGVPAPVVEVTGRTYPVEVRYRPLLPDDDAPAEAASGRRESEPARGDPDPTRGDPDPTRNISIGDFPSLSDGNAPTRHIQRADDPFTTGHNESIGDFPSLSDGNAPSRRPKEQRRPKTARREPAPAEARDPMTAICEAVDELCAEGPGDILVFLSGEREIRDAEDALRNHLGARVSDPRSPRAIELVPLYSRLSSAEQHRVFEAHTVRRVILATNVAETSLTVPGVRYVVDPGTARISRWSKATKVQRLPIEPISQASANQRAGRCGRVADGVAIRLYSEADYASRPEFTEPEILRTSLASVILQMVAVGVAASPDDVAKFPFVDPPDMRAVRDGVALLTELGALDTGLGRTRLTDVGRALAMLPIDPRLARMVVEAGRRDVAREVMIIAAALSIQDPRERPAEQRPQADQAHARFADPTSDFLALLNLWHYLRDRQRELSGSAFRRLCRAEFLNYLRIREWQDVVAQLKELARPLGIVVRPPGKIADDPGRIGGDSPDLRLPWDADRIHQSLLAGLLSHIGMQEATEVRVGARGKAPRGGRPRSARNEYLGARGARFAVFPGSPLSRRPPAWLMAGELVETSRLWARDVAKISPEWAEELGGSLLRRVYGEPAWSTKQGAAVVQLKVLLYGLPIVADRRVLLGTVDPEQARELFISHALVQGEWTTHHKFFAANQALLAEAEQVENRARRRGLVADEDALFAFYDERIPDTVVSARHFDTWWKGMQRTHPDLLDLSLDVLVGEAAVDEGEFPSAWPQGDVVLPLTYEFEPGSEADGVTVDIPLSVLARVRPEGFDWLVPGLHEELVVGLIRGLPKALRVPLVPAPDAARAIVEWIRTNEPSWADTVRAADMAPSLASVLSRAVRVLRGVEIADDAWDASGLPPHLRIRFRAVEQRGRAVSVVDESADLVALQRRLAARSEDAVRAAVRSAVRTAMAEVAGSGVPGGGSVTPASLRDACPEPSPDRPSSRNASAGELAGVSDPPPRAPTRATNAPTLERTGLSGWPADLPDGRIPEVITTSAGGLTVHAYPALVVTTRGFAQIGASDAPNRARSRRDDGGARAVDLRVLATAGEQATHHRAGVRELLLGGVGLATARITTRWTSAESLSLAASPYPSTAALVADLQRAAIDGIAAERGVELRTVRDADTYARLRNAVRDGLEDSTYATARGTAAVLTAARELDADVRANTSLALLSATHDIRDQLAGLVHDGFVADAGSRLSHLVRYLRAARYRLSKAAENPGRDESLAWQVAEVSDAYDDAVTAARASAPDPARDARLEQARWMLEEFRVSLFAQQLGTAQPVSAKRIRATLAG